jgi:hypothetical protein
VLLFETDDLALSLNLEQETTGEYTLSGQILSSGPIGFEGGYARLTAQRADVAPAQMELEAHGAFLFPNVRPGVYQMVVNLPEHRVVVPSLSLEPE